MKTTTMTHQEMTKHIRQRIQKAGIKASVVKQVNCGIKTVRVSTRAYEQEFTADEQSTINKIAKTNGLTNAACIEINTEIQFGQEAWFQLNQ
jgi:hypothetical protein